MNLLNSSIVSIEEMTASQGEGLWQLFKKYYSFANREVFFKDLNEKTDVILLNDDKEVIRGFTTIHKYSFVFKKKTLTIVFSGNTIIQPEFWGSQHFVRTLGYFLGELKAQDISCPLYWFLICSGFRTYRYLPLFYKEFYPRFDKPTPPYEEELMQALATKKFPEEYRNGVIQVKEKQDCLLESLADHKKRRNPHIDFFIKQNPGYGRGNELVCLAEFSIENMTDLAQRVGKEALLRVKECIL